MSLQPGYVIFKGLPLLRMCSKFRALIITVPDLRIPIIAGSLFECYLHGDEVR